MRLLRTGTLLGLGGLFAAAACQLANTRRDDGPWRYELTWDAARSTLRGTVSAPAGVQLELPDDGDAMPFVFDRSDEAATTNVRRWSLDLDVAAAAINDVDRLAARGRGFVGGLASLLWLPHDAPDEATFTLRVMPPPGQTFVCAADSIDAADAAAIDANVGDDGWRGTLGDLRAGPACAFGEIAVRHVEAAGVRITLAEPDPRSAAATAALDAHVRDCANAVAAWYGTFPVDRLLLLVVPTRGPMVGSGAARGFGGASIRLDAPRHLGAKQYARDWVLIHEMVHLAMPSLPPAHHWLEEGSATYLEPWIQLQAGRVRAADAWTAMLSEYAQGLAEPAAGGLDDDSSWGRTYYGGALFCLLADLRIRERTHGARSLRDAMRALPAAGANLRTESGIDAVLALGDAATGTTVLRELYEAMGRQPMALDLDALWRELGVRLVDGRAVFDDAAPRALLRAALFAAAAR